MCHNRQHYSAVFLIIVVIVLFVVCCVPWNRTLKGPKSPCWTRHKWNTIIDHIFTLYLDLTLAGKHVKVFFIRTSIHCYLGYSCSYRQHLFISIFFLYVVLPVRKPNQILRNFISHAHLTSHVYLVMSSLAQLFITTNFKFTKSS